MISWYHNTYQPTSIDRFGVTCYLPTMEGIEIRPRRKQFGLRLAIDLMKEVKHLAVDEGKTMNELVEEGLRELLRKYRRPVKV